MPTQKERPQSWLPLFNSFVSSPQNLPYANWASQEGGVFVSPEFLTSVCEFSFVPFLCFCLFVCFPSLSFSHCHFGLLFPILTTNIPPSIDGRPNSLGIETLRSLWLLPVELGQQGSSGLPLLQVSSLRVLIVLSI